MSILDQLTDTTTSKRADARTRVLQALRAAGSQGLRRDALEIASTCRSVVQRVQELRQLGHVIESRTDTTTDFSVYVLVREVAVERETTTQNQIRMTLSKPRTAEVAARLAARLAELLAELEADEDRAHLDFGFGTTTNNQAADDREAPYVWEEVDEDEDDQW